MTNDNVLKDMLKPDRDTGAFDWSGFMDEDMFSMFVKYAYTGDYAISKTRMTQAEVTKRHAVYEKAREKDPEAFWLYQSSPHVEVPTPWSSLRLHAQVWNFAKCSNIKGLEKVSAKHLAEMMGVWGKRGQPSDPSDPNYACQSTVVEMMDAICYVYHHGMRRYWRPGGAEAKPQLLGSESEPVRTMMAWQASNFFRNKGMSIFIRVYKGPGIVRFYLRIWKKWVMFLQDEPAVALDMVMVNWVQLKRARLALFGEQK